MYVLKVMKDPYTLTEEVTQFVNDAQQVRDSRGRDDDTISVATSSNALVDSKSESKFKVHVICSY